MILAPLFHLEDDWCAGKTDRPPLTPMATNVVGPSGNFTITATNAVDPNAPQRFYILQLQ